MSQGYAAEWSMDELEAEGYSAEEIGAIAQEEETARAAWVAMQDARRTLRDARARQHANVTPVLPSETRRQGWRWQPVEADGVGSLWKQMGSSKPGIECFRSGGPHKIADCKEKPKGVEQAKVATATEAAPFVFWSSQDTQKQGCELNWHGEHLRCTTSSPM